ncbi:MAG: sulfurtransferase [Verrucomicrobia bacterium]|nr:sulfurtransferase [Verrucomicrobiota bacterium]
MLVSTASLDAHLNDPAWVIFDCRHDLMDHAKGARLYREGHLPGAHFAPVETALSGPKTGTNGRHPLPAPADFLAFLARHGVSSASTVVAYDDVGGQYAARLWWLARWVGFHRVLLLDGGLPKWLAEKRPLSTDVPVPVPATLAGQADPGLLWDVSAVQRHITEPDHALIDARAAERYRGETESIDPVAGHIPGALNRFFKLNLQPDLTFRPAAELCGEFVTLLQGRAPAHVGHQCGSGITACVNLFAMEYAGLPGSKLYPGSWSEWIADPARPTVPARQ